MYRKCCVPQCRSLRQDVKFHRFPSKDKNKRQWLKSINCARFMNSDVRNLYVCHKHFEHQFVNTSTKRLKSGACPSLFTELEISSGRPNNFCIDIAKTSSKEHSYHRKRHIDHSYTLPTDHTNNTEECSEVFCMYILLSKIIFCLRSNNI